MTRVGGMGPSLANLAIGSPGPFLPVQAPRASDVRAGYLGLYIAPVNKQPATAYLLNRTVNVKGVPRHSTERWYWSVTLNAVTAAQTTTPTQMHLPCRVTVSEDCGLVAGEGGCFVARFAYRLGSKKWCLEVAVGSEEGGLLARAGSIAFKQVASWEVQGKGFFSEAWHAMRGHIATFRASALGEDVIDREGVSDGEVTDGGESDGARSGRSTRSGSGKGKKRAAKDSNPPAPQKKLAGKGSVCICGMGGVGVVSGEWLESLSACPIIPQWCHVVPDYTTPALYRTKESVFLRGAASPPPYISLAAPVFSYELPAHDPESDKSLCDLGLRVVRGAVEAKECKTWYRILVDSCGTQPDAIWDLMSNADSREECLADPKLPRRWGTWPGKVISVLGRDPLQRASQQCSARWPEMRDLFFQTHWSAIVDLYGMPHAAYMWVHHMYAYVARWGTIARFSCFALEGSHVRLRRLLRNSGRVSLLNDRSGLQCVVDNHTLDDNLRKEGWEVESRSVTKQRGIPRRCTTWSPARRERKGRENMVRRIVERALRQRTK